MDRLFTRQQIRGKIIRFAILVGIMWLLYVRYYFFNESIQHIGDTNSIWKHNGIRFLLRELVVYTFGLMGYFYIKYEKLDPIFRLQFWLILALIDILCLSIGLFRQFVFEVELLHDIYNHIIGFLASPVYVICFGIYSLYFSYSDKIDIKS